MLDNLAPFVTAALALLTTIVALRLLFLTAIGFISPSIHIGAATGADGKVESAVGLSQLIQSELASLKEEGGGPSVQLVTGPDAVVDIGSIDNVSDQLKTVNALLRLLPGRTRSVTLQVLPTGAMGQGLSVTIQGSTGRIGATTTLWERRFLPIGLIPSDIAADDDKKTPASTEALACLGLAAAAWIAYQALKGSPATDRAGLLTQSWESYALFRVAARMQFLGAFTPARRLYLDALRDDPRNRGALFNLGVLDIQDRNERAAMERFDSLLDEMRRARPEDDDSWQFDRLWYRAQYNRAAAEWNGASDGHEPGAVIRRNVRGRLRELVAAADMAIEELGGDDAVRFGSRHAELIRFLVDIRAASIVIYQDAKAA